MHVGGIIEPSGGGRRAENERRKKDCATGCRCAARAGRRAGQPGVTRRDMDGIADDGTRETPPRHDAIVSGRSGSCRSRMRLGKRGLAPQWRAGDENHALPARGNARKTARQETTSAGGRTWEAGSREFRSPSLFSRPSRSDQRRSDLARRSPRFAKRRDHARPLRRGARRSREKLRADIAADGRRRRADQIPFPAAGVRNH